MRSRKLVFVLGLIILGGLGLVLAGCSSDDTPTSLTDTTDTQYTTVTSQVSDLVDSSLSLVSQRLRLVDLGTQTDTVGRLAEILMTAFGVDSVYESGGWLVMYDADLGAAYSNFYLDSIQFRNGSTILPNGRNADRMTVHRRWQVTCLDTTQSHTNYAMTAQYLFTNLNAEQVQVNANVGLDVESMETGLLNNYENMSVTMTGTGLEVMRSGNPSINGCPSSGTCQVTVNMETWRGTYPSTENQWTLALSFEGGLATATVSGSAMDTTYTQQFCTCE